MALKVSTYSKTKLGRMSWSNSIRIAMVIQQVVAEASFERGISDSWFPVLPCICYSLCLGCSFPRPLLGSLLLILRVSAQIAPPLSTSSQAQAHLPTPEASIPFPALFSKCGCHQPVLSHLPAYHLTLLSDCQLHEGQVWLSAARCLDCSCMSAPCMSM